MRKKQGPGAVDLMKSDRPLWTLQFWRRRTAGDGTAIPSPYAEKRRGCLPG